MRKKGRNLPKTQMKKKKVENVVEFGTGDGFRKEENVNKGEGNQSRKETVSGGIFTRRKSSQEKCKEGWKKHWK